MKASSLRLIDVKRELARRNYYHYVKLTHEQIYTYTRHGEFIANVLNDAVEQRKRMLNGEIPLETQYIMFSVPAQHGKSMHITETFPSFFLGKFPHDGVIEISYNDTFASLFGSRNKDKIKEFGIDLFGIDMAKDSQSKNEWSIIDSQTGKKTRGGMISRGVMSGITGSSWGDCIIIDDPIKNREEANSETYREKIWQEWSDSIRRRIHPGGIVILIMTRWHEDDLWGRLLNSEYAEPFPWKVYNLPLECDETHIEKEGNPLNRKLGEPLWPERYGYKHIEEAKRYPSSFNAMDQGRPTSQEGNILKRAWWQYYDVLPPIATKILSVDASFKDTQSSAKCSIQVWGKTDAYYYKIDNVTDKMDFITTLQVIRNILKKHPDIGAKFVEDKANGSAIINVLNKEIGGFIPVQADSGTGGKEARVHAVSPWIESGNVYLPRGATFTHDFVEECASFPNGQYKDQVDAMSQALNKLIYFWSELPQAPKKELPWMFRNDEKEEGYMSWT